MSPELTTGLFTLGGVVVGLIGARIQARGAHAQAQAALEQARAALEVAQQQIRAEHSHWRRSVRREAYVAFITAVHAFADTAIEAIRSQRDAEHLFDVLQTNARSMTMAEAALRLEGPEQVAAACRRVMTARAPLFEAIRGYLFPGEGTPQERGNRILESRVILMSALDQFIAVAGEQLDAAP